MKLTVLMDNQTLIDRYFRAEPAVAYWLELDQHVVLFDTGYSGLFMENAAQLGITAIHPDFIVLSHGHNDHSQGLEALLSKLDEAKAERGFSKKPVLVAHPAALAPKRSDGLTTGCRLNPVVAAEALSLQLSVTGFELLPRLWFLGEIPRYFDFEPAHSIGECHQAGSWQPDALADDSGLAWVGTDGLVIISGCAHAGICNMVRHAQLLSGERRIQAIVGGFHLLEAEPARIRATVNNLAEQAVKRVHAGHCTGFAAKAALAAALNQQEIGVGSRLSFR